MINVFPIEFVRKILLKQLLMNHISDSYNVGGDNLINIFSFYEQLRTETGFEKDSRIKFVGTVYEKELIKDFKPLYDRFIGEHFAGGNLGRLFR